MPNPSRYPRPGDWVKIRLPNGRSALVSTRIDPKRGRLVIIKPLPEHGAHHAKSA